MERGWREFIRGNGPWGPRRWWEPRWRWRRWTRRVAGYSLSFGPSNRARRFAWRRPTAEITAAGVVGDHPRVHRAKYDLGRDPGRVLRGVGFRGCAVSTGQGSPENLLGKADFPRRQAVAARAREESRGKREGTTAPREHHRQRRQRRDDPTMERARRAARKREERHSAVSPGLGSPPIPVHAGLASLVA